MRLRASLALIAVLAGTASCAEILGLRAPGHRPFEHRTHVLKGIACTRCHAGITTEPDRLHLPLRLVVHHERLPRQASRRARL